MDKVRSHSYREGGLGHGRGRQSLEHVVESAVSNSNRVTETTNIEHG